jgi:hypothetical protein
MKTLLKLTALPGLLAVLALPAPAQVQPTTLRNLTTNVIEIGAVASTNLSAVPAIEIWQGRGLSLAITLAGTNAATTTNIQFRFAVSVDGTNYANNASDLLAVTVTPQGTTKVVGYTNLPPALLDNARSLKLVTITNGNLALAASWFLSNIVAGAKN